MLDGSVLVCYNCLHVGEPSILPPTKKRPKGIYGCKECGHIVFYMGQYVGVIKTRGL